MFRGTTPRLEFKTSLDATQFDEFYVTFVQGRQIVLEKQKEECKVDEQGIIIELSQEETLKFNVQWQVMIQIKARIGKHIITHTPIITSVRSILKEGVI